MADKTKIYEWLDSHENLAVDLLENLIRCPSVNPYFDDEEKYKGEGKAQSFLRGYLEKMGFTTELSYPDAEKLAAYKDKTGYMADHTFKDRPNLYGVLKGKGGGKSIFLSGHMDVVARGNGWMTDPFDPEIRNGNVYGLGSVDMKGGIAAMVMAVKAIRESGVALRGDVKIGTVVDEEAGGMGTLALMAKQYRADGCIITEPTHLNLAPLCRGILWGKIIIEGHAGHIELNRQDWREGGAVDAIDKAAYILDFYDELNKRWAVTKKNKYMSIPCQIRFAQFEAGEYPTTFANHAELTFDAQYLPQEKDENGLGGTVKKEIEDFLAAVSQTDPWLRENPPHIEWILDADCGETSDQADFFRTVSESLRQVCPDMQIKGNTAHIDMGWFCNVGIPTLNFGPGNPELCHQSNEHLPVVEYIKCAKALASAIMDWCGCDE